MKHPRVRFPWLSVCGLLLLPFLSPWARAQDWIADLPEAEGRDVLSTLCIRCHDLQRVVGQRRDRQVWRQTVHSMLPPEEMAFLEEEVEILVDYLARYLGPLVPSHETLQKNAELREQYLRGEIFSLIDLNTASPHELQRLPGIDESMAARIVAFRSSRGDFSSIEELRRVEGIDETILSGLRGLIETR